MSGWPELLCVALTLSGGWSGTRSTEIETVYEKSGAPQIWAQVVVRPLPAVGIGLQGSYSWRKGNALLKDSALPSTDIARMKAGTFGLRIEGRLEVELHQPVIPYVVAGPLWTFYRESAGELVHGVKPGAQVGLGLSILLTPETTYSMAPHPRFEGLYLTMEGGHRWAKWRTKEGMDLGGWHVHGGVEVAFR